MSHINIRITKTVRGYVARALGDSSYNASWDDEDVLVSGELNFVLDYLEQNLPAELEQATQLRAVPDVGETGE